MQGLQYGLGLGRAYLLIKFIVIQFVAPSGRRKTEQTVARQFIGIGIATEFHLIHIGQLKTKPRQSQRNQQQTPFLLSGQRPISKTAGLTG